MPVQLFSAARRDRTNRFPGAITDEDLGTFFTLSEDMKRLAAWLLAGAREHDTPAPLPALACEPLQRERLVRPGVT